MSKRHGHTNTRPGQRVAVVLQDGTVIDDRFVRRPVNRRWIELEKHGRIAMGDIKAMAAIKGELDLKRLGMDN